jgi:uncharacterized protein YdhG (YjbR/CyaY superfamily)
VNVNGYNEAFKPICTRVILFCRIFFPLINTKKNAMQSKATTIETYMQELPAERRMAMQKLHTTILKNLPPGFKECMSYGMIGYVVPHSLYPAGYHCDPKLPLPFMCIASQKNFIAVYHMGLYSNKNLLGWFTSEYVKSGIGKLDMGKGCIRFKNVEKIPFDLVGELAGKITTAEWIKMYESVVRR